MFKVGDRVCVSNDTIAKGVVVDIIPGNEYRHPMYRVRFDSTGKVVVTLTPTPNESWIDESRIIGPVSD